MLNMQSLPVKGQTDTGAGLMNLLRFITCCTVALITTALLLYVVSVFSSMTKLCKENLLQQIRVHLQ